MSDLPDLAPIAAFAELGRMDFGQMALQDVLGRVAELAKATIPGADHVSVTLLQDGTASTVAFTGDLAMELDEKQYESGYGPCLDAAEAAEILIVEDMETEDPWPMFAARAREYGAFSSMSVGLPVQQEITGAINHYSETPHAFDEEALTLGKSFAGYAAVALSNAKLYASNAALAKHMQQAMESRAVIEQAKGVIAGQEHITTEEAFTILSRRSQSSNRKLRDVAADIVHQAAKG